MSWTDTDPGQGDPDGVLVLAAKLQSDADDAATASRMLRSVQSQTSDAIWRGASADAFRERIDKLPAHLDKLQASYSDAAAGLRAYATSVRQIADDAVAQQRLIAQSQSDAEVAASQQSAWTPPLDPLTGHPDVTAANPHDATVAAAHASVRKAQSRLLDLAGQRKAADGRIIGSLKHAHGEGMQNKRWWQHALDAVSDVLSKITIVLMVVALVAIVVLAIVQPELIPGLLLLAGESMSALSAAQLVVDGARKASGENVSWGSLALDAVGALSGAGAVGALGRLAESAPLIGRTVGAVRDLSAAVRDYGAAGGAFAQSIGTDLKATRFVIRLADTGIGITAMAKVEREGKTAGQMLSDARDAASSEPRPIRTRARGFTISEGGTGTRKINYRPNAADPNWGLTRTHVGKHLFGSGRSALAQIDSAGTAEIWMRYLQDLAGRPPTAVLKGGVIDVVGDFPRSDGVGTFKFGIRLAPKADGTFDLVTLLTRQNAN